MPPIDSAKLAVHEGLAAQPGAMNFELTDRTGNPTYYVYRYHDASDGPSGGATISLRLIAAGIEPLGRVLAETLRAVQDSAEIKAMLADALTNPNTTVSITDLISGDAVGAFARDFRTVMMSGAIDAKLINDILSQTYRNGERLTPAVIAQAYAGNYVELYAAAFRVAKENGFFPVPGI